MSLGEKDGEGQEVERKGSGRCYSERVGEWVNRRRKKKGKKEKTTSEIDEREGTPGTSYAPRTVHTRRALEYKAVTTGNPQIATALLLVMTQGLTKRRR